MALFRDRHDAGRRLADRLGHLAGRPDTIVLALPRGGIPVGFEVADALEAPLDVLVVRKIGAPWNEELALGAIASGGFLYVDDAMLNEVQVARHELDATIARESAELARREALYRGTRPPADLTGRIVILVDDGLATGSTMRVAVHAVRARHAARIIVAVPVASAQACAMLAGEAGTCIAVAQPEPFFGVGAWYDDFAQTSDAEVIDLLARAAPHNAGRASAWGFDRK